MALSLRLCGRLAAARPPLAAARPPLTAARPPLAAVTSRLATSSRCAALQPYSAEEWEKKNERMGRPMSPHLSIYKFQLTSVLSITHRATGIALHCALLGLGGAMVLLPHSYPYYLTLLAGSAAGKAAIALAKFAVSWPFFFHTLNGVRHLVWDMGQGFSLKALYSSGYTVVALSVLAAAVASLM